MLTKDEMYDLYFNKGYVIAVRLDEFGAFVGDLIDRDYITLAAGKKMYRRAKNYSEYRNASITYWMGKVYNNGIPIQLFRDYVKTAIDERYLILYSAQDTVNNLKLRIAEQTQKMKDNNDEIKKCKDEIKELYVQIGDLRLENTSMYVDSILKDKKCLKKYGMNRGD